MPGDPTSITAPLVKLTGLQFRQQELECCHCGWQGRAGQLKVPSTAALGSGVQYSCPSCWEIIAAHDGLNATEIEQELRHIQALLDEEFASRSLADGKNRRREQPFSVDFNRVREQLQATDEAPAAGRSRVLDSVES